MSNKEFQDAIARHLAKLQKKHKMPAVEVGFFDEDPDGEQDRYGDGYYFQYAGEENWSGPYETTGEARTQAAEDFEYRLETRAREAALAELSEKVPSAAPRP